MPSYRKLIIQQLTGDFRTSTGVAEESLRDPGPGEALVRNRYAGCNAIFDKNLCRNKIRYVDVVPPYDMGIESVGEIVALGPNTSGYAVGDAVATVKLGTGYRQFQTANVGLSRDPGDSPIRRLSLRGSPPYRADGDGRDHCGLSCGWRHRSLRGAAGETRRQSCRRYHWQH